MLSSTDSIGFTLAVLVAVAVLLLLLVDVLFAALPCVLDTMSPMASAPNHAALRPAPAGSPTCRREITVLPTVTVRGCFDSCNI